MVDRLEQPAYALHALVAVLDRAADRILQERLGITFNRYLTLLTLQRLGQVTQRELAAELGVSEPSVSRSLPVLADEEFLTVTSVAGGGNRRSVALTTVGEKLVDDAADILESSFAQLMSAAGVEPDQILGITSPLLGVLAGSTDDQGDPS
ncbi:MAG: MarR family winged helix-turn-helix transcriptional regulator [Aeromicrobium sp.]